MRSRLQAKIFQSLWWLLCLCVGTTENSFVIVLCMFGSNRQVFCDRCVFVREQTTFLWWLLSVRWGGAQFLSTMAVKDLNRLHWLRSSCIWELHLLQYWWWRWWRSLSRVTSAQSERLFRGTLPRTTHPLLQVNADDDDDDDDDCFCDSVREKVTDSSEVRSKGWKRVALLALFFQPGGFNTVPLGRAFSVSVCLPMHVVS